MEALSLRLKDKTNQGTAPTKELDPDGAASCFGEKFPSNTRLLGAISLLLLGNEKAARCMLLKINYARETSRISCVCSQAGLKYLKRGDSKLSGISRALRFVSTFGVKNKEIQICTLKFPHSILDCHNNRHGFPSKEKVRLGSTYKNSPAIGPQGGSIIFEITQTKLFYRLQ